LPERLVLAENGDKIRVIEAQGELFFGSAERLIRRVREVQCDFLILDLRRVFSTDEAARTLLLRLVDAENAGPRRLIFAHLDDEGSLAPLYHAMEASAGPLTEIAFDDRDAALEYCEDRLIAAASAFRAGERYALAEMDIFRGLADEDMTLVESAARPFVFERGQVILREGEKGKLFFVIARGVVSVRINVRETALEGGETRSLRLATIGAGLPFGQMALLDGQPRSADVVADEKVVAYGFSIEELREIGAQRPAILIAILTNIAADLSERLRASTNEIRALQR
jgi:glutaminase